MKKLIIFLAVFLMAGQCYAVDINDWIRGDGSDAIKGTDNVSDIDANATAYLQDPIDRLLSHHLWGITLTHTSDDVITLSAGEVTCSNGAGTIRRMRKNTATTTVDFTAAGVGGIDSGSARDDSSLFDIYAVADANATTFTAIAGKRGTALSDVTYYRYLGTVFNDASDNLKKQYCHGNGSTVKITYDDVYLVTDLRVLTAGAAAAFVANNVDCSSVVPTSATMIDINWQDTVANAILYLRRGGSTATSGFVTSLASGSGMDYQAIENIPCSSAKFEYYVNAGKATMWVKGYTYER